MIKKIIIFWFIVHVSYIVCVNCLGSYEAYNEFHNYSKRSELAIALKGMFNLPFIKMYGRYTGAETGYGFFGINVRSNGVLLAECNKQKVSPSFQSYETSLRFFSLSSAVTDDLLKSERPEHSDTIGNKLSNEYNKLIFKSIAIALYNKNNCTDSTIKLSYNLIDFPMLNEVRQGVVPIYTLQNIATMKYRMR